VHKVIGDGSCCFSAAWWALTGENGSAVINELRQQVQHYINAHPADFIGDAVDDPVADPQPRHWGGQAELLAISRMERSQIHVFNINTPTMFTSTYGELDGHTQRVYLVYTGGHYDALCVDDRTRRFAVTDVNALNAAQQCAVDMHLLQHRPRSPQPISSVSNRRRRRRSSDSSSSSGGSNKENRRPSPRTPQRRKKRYRPVSGNVNANNASASSPSLSRSTTAAAEPVTPSSSATADVDMAVPPSSTGDCDSVAKDGTDYRNIVCSLTALFNTDPRRFVQPPGRANAVPPSQLELERRRFVAVEVLRHAASQVGRVVELQHHLLYLYVVSRLDQSQPVTTRLVDRGAAQLGWCEQLCSILQGAQEASIQIAGSTIQTTTQVQVRSHVW